MSKQPLKNVSLLLSPLPKMTCVSVKSLLMTRVKEAYNILLIPPHPGDNYVVKCLLKPLIGRVKSTLSSSMPRGSGDQGIDWCIIKDKDITSYQLLLIKTRSHACKLKYLLLWLVNLELFFVLLFAKNGSVGRWETKHLLLLLSNNWRLAKVVWF